MQEETFFHSVDLDSLVIDTILDFELYSRAHNDKFVLFRGNQSQFTFEHRDQLLANGIQTLYVSEQDQDNYGKYIEKNISRLVMDPTVPATEKANLMYSVSKGVLLDAFANPRSGDIVKRTEEIMTPMVYLITRGKESLHNLISIMSHDYYTFTHSINVCVFTVALANQIGLDDKKDLHDLATGALLHDIGKSEIPKEILTKSGPLTPEEFEVMKTHVVLGEKILSEKSHMNAQRMLAVSLHHERADGKGYPRGLISDDIHIHGRIAAIADCYDAMTTKRSYANAKPGFEALQLMMGKLKEGFDQELLRSFTGLLVKAE